MGVGGMIGGGIFSVLGLTVKITGHAAPIAFALGGIVALTAGYSYVKHSLAYRSDGASFTFLEKAFPGQPNIAGITGWTVIVGYIGTLALYGFTFGAYAADLLGMPDVSNVRLVLSASIILGFMLVSIGVSVANLRLRAQTESKAIFILPGFLLMLATVVTLVVYLWQTARPTLMWIGGIYLVVVIVELGFSKRKLIQKQSA